MVNIILGGGIAGLWLLNRLNNAGKPTLLIDTGPIGGLQTLSAQGIIHGGIKYSLSGSLSGSAKAIATMPQRWRDCLQGKGEIDLSKTKVLSEHQYMWSSQGLSGKVTTFFSSKAVSSKMQRVNPADYPEFFTHPDFHGTLYQLNESVVDTTSLVKNLTDHWPKAIIQSQDYELVQGQNKRVEHIVVNQQKIPVDHLILTAGQGNEQLTQKLGLKHIRMQTRPLQMVLLKGKNLVPLYAHCIGANTKPLLTITTHRHQDGDYVWYIGGNIAEEGVHQSKENLIADTGKLLAQQLPWMDFNRVQWSTHVVDRAEPLQRGLLRPDTVSLQQDNNIFTCWPTKLALSPLLADQVLEKISSAPSEESRQQTSEASLSHESSFNLAEALWDRTFK